MPEVKEVQPDIFSVTKEYELPEVGLHEITLTKIEDLGLVEHPQFGKQPRLKFYFRVDDQNDSKTKQPMRLFRTFTNATTPKSHLGIFLRELSIPIPTPPAKINYAELVGMRMNANSVHNGTFANIMSVSRIRTKGTASSGVTEL